MDYVGMSIYCIAIHKGRTSQVAQWFKKKKILQLSRRLGFNPWVKKIPWRRRWQTTLVFLAVRFHGQKHLAGYCPWGLKELDVTEHAYTLILSYKD